MFGRSLLTASALIVFSASADAQFLSRPIAGATRTEDVIYGRKNGVALTMDVFEPKAKPNGAGVIVCVSAEFRSGKEMLNQIAGVTAPQFLDRGYVVFMVTHGSQPVFTVPDIVGQVHRAVRFIKANAKKFNVDPDRLGIAGASSGGQLCLMMGCAGTTGDSRSSDPIEKQSSKVAAVACIFPLSDFLEFDKDNLPPQWERFRALLDVHEFSPMTNRLERVTPARRTQYARACSPLYCVKKDAAPTFIVHGDADKLIPVRQSRDLTAEFKKCGATCEYLEVKGMGHSAIEAAPYLPKLADWFDKQLLKK
jgi:acetyl esterase/lipase